MNVRQSEEVKDEEIIEDNNDLVRNCVLFCCSLEADTNRDYHIPRFTSASCTYFKVGLVYWSAFYVLIGRSKFLSFDPRRSIEK